MLVADYFYARVCQMHDRHGGRIGDVDEEKLSLYADMKRQAVNSVAYGKSSSELQLVAWLDFGDASGAIVEQWTGWFQVRTGKAAKLKHVARRLADKHGLSRTRGRWEFSFTDDGGNKTVVK